MQTIIWLIQYHDVRWSCDNNKVDFKQFSAKLKGGPRPGWKRRGANYMSPSQCIDRQKRGFQPLDPHDLPLQTTFLVVLCWYDKLRVCYFIVNLHFKFPSQNSISTKADKHDYFGFNHKYNIFPERSWIRPQLVTTLNSLGKKGHIITEL